MPVCNLIMEQPYTTITTTILRHCGFVQDYPGELAPER